MEERMEEGLAVYRIHNVAVGVSSLGLDSDSDTSCYILLSKDICQGNREFISTVT